MRDSAAAHTGSQPGAIASGQRLVLLDVLRGFALFGVLLVNLPFAAMPADAAMTPVGGTAAPWSDLVPWALIKGLGETKFVSLFSLLFGIGLVLQLGRAEARGASTGFYVRRLVILAVLGLGHGLLLWHGDILLPYAVAGFVLYLLRKKSPRTLIRLAVPLLVIGIALSAGVTLLDDSSSGDAGLAGQEETSELGRLLGTDESWTEIEARAWTEGPLKLTMTVRALEYIGWLILSCLISFNWHVMALFLVGAAIMKRGWLGTEYRAEHGRLACWALAIGIALEAVAVGLQLSTNFAAGTPAAVASLFHEVGSLVLAAGYLGSVAWLVHGKKLQALHAPFSAVGRTALTSYLGQSVAFNLLFPWYGLGLWGDLTRAQLVGLVFLVYIVQMLLAILWLRRFTMGPCEWLWRWLTYGKRPGLLIRER